MTHRQYKERGLIQMIRGEFLDENIARYKMEQRRLNAEQSEQIETVDGEKMADMQDGKGGD